MTMELTAHAQGRLDGRLAGLVTAAEVQAATSRPLPKGKVFIQVKRIPYCEIPDPSVQPDGIARGDSIVALVENDDWPRIVTIMLRKSWSKSASIKVLGG
jgi:hypothetical protein